MVEVCENWKCSFCDLWLASRTYFSPNLWLVSWFLAWALDLWYLAWSLAFGCQITSCPRVGFQFWILAPTASCSLTLKSYMCFWNFPFRTPIVLLTFLFQLLCKTLVIRIRIARFETHPFPLGSLNGGCRAVRTVFQESLIPAHHEETLGCLCAHTCVMCRWVGAHQHSLSPRWPWQVCLLAGHPKS